MCIWPVGRGKDKKYINPLDTPKLFPIVPRLCSEQPNRDLSQGDSGSWKTHLFCPTCAKSPLNFWTISGFSKSVALHKDKKKNATEWSTGPLSTQPVNKLHTGTLLFVAAWHACWRSCIRSMKVPKAVLWTDFCSKGPSLKSWENWSGHGKRWASQTSQQA